MCARRAVVVVDRDTPTPFTGARGPEGGGGGVDIVGWYLVYWCCMRLNWGRKEGGGREMKLFIT